MFHEDVADNEISSLEYWKLIMISSKEDKVNWPP